MNKEDLGLELNNNSVNIETTPEYVDMDKLSLSAPVEFLSKYNSPKEWILDQDEAERVKVFTQPANREVGTLEKIEYGLGNVGYNVGRAVPETAQLGLGLVSGIEKTIFPNSTDTALDRLYKDVAISNAKNRERRENIVAGFTGGDSSIVKWSDAIGELGLFLGTAGVGAGIGASAARRGIQKLATETAKGVATSPSVVRRAASVAATRGARKGQIAATLGTTFTQEGGSSAVDKVRQYIEETGDTELKNYNPTADTLTALSVGAINAAIEVGFGVERFIPEFWGTGTNFNRAARRFVEGALGEGVEEFAQDLTSQIGDIINGYREDIDWGQAWDNAIVGGVLGGAAGSTMYYLNRRRMARKISNDYGLDYKKAASIVDDMLGTGIERTTNELSAQTELATEQGQAWDKLVNGVKTAMETVDFADETSRNNQATAFAKTNASIAMRLARKSGLSTDEFLDIAEFTNMNNGQNLNMVFVKPLGTVADIDKRIAEQDTIINREKELKKTGAGDNNVLNRAKQRKAILQKAKAIKQYNDKQYQEQLKAQTTPELAKEIETATKDAEVVKELPTQADFGSKVESENLTSAEKSKRYGNAVLKSILPTKTDFDAVMVDPMYANAKQAIIAVADRINSFIKAHRTYSLKTDIANALKKMQTVNQGNFIDSVTTPDLDGVDVIAENAFLYHFLFSDATTIQTYLDSYITRAEDSLNQKKGNLSKKDLVGQSFKATDNAMQTQAQVIGAEYTSIYNEDGSYADKNVMAVMLSYQNQFVQEQPTTQYSLPFFDGEITTYYKNGNIKPKVLEKIYSLFTEEELNHIPKYYSQTLREILNNSFGKEHMNLALKSSASAETINDAARRAEITPLQMYNAIRISRGLEPVQEQPKPQTIEYSDSEVLGIFAQAKNNGDITLDNWENVRWSSLLSAGDTYQKGKRHKPATEAEKAKFARKMLDKYLPGWNQVSEPQQLTLFQEQFDIADENARLDDIYPAYDGETIEVDGKERTVYNSNGDRIAKSKEALTNFWRWFGDSKVVDEQGRPLVVYHGSTRKFVEFDISKSNKESNLGAGFYFTDNEEDVSSNYEGGGADFDNRVDRLAEQIEQEEGIDYEEARIKAYEQEFAESTKYDVYLKMENPFVIGGENETVLTFEEKYNEETDEYEEPTGTLLDFAYALDNELADLGIDDYKVSSGLFERAAENGGEITASEINDLLDGDEQLSNMLLDYGNESVGQLLSDAVGIEYDGFIDHTVSKKFGSERKVGVAMAGVDSDTTHYVAFNSTQIKSVDNRGTYSSDTGNIYFQDESVRPETARIKYLQDNLDEWQKYLDETVEPNVNNWSPELVEDNRKRAKKAISNIKKEIKELEESLKEPIEDKLYATHNMSLAGVKGALKLGGLAMPSLAVRKVSQGNINQFGDIVFVGGSKMVEPSRTTDVFDRDAWTPSLAYNMKYELNEKGRDFIRDVVSKHKTESGASVFLYNIENDIDSPKSNIMAMQLYCLDRGIDYNSVPHYELSNSLDYLTWYEENITGNSDPYLWAENADNTDMKKYKYTLDNMMRILKRQERSGGGFLGDTVLTVSHLLQFTANKYKNLKEIKENKNKLVSREEQTAAINALDEEFYRVAEELKLDGKDYEHYENRTGLAVAAINNPSEIKENLARYNLDTSDESVEKVKQFTEKMKDVVTDYFEVKPRRIVDFNEFSGVIVPKGAEYDSVASQLEDSGIFVQRVEKGNEEQYKDALMEIQRRYKTVLFQSKKANGFYDPELGVIVLGRNMNEMTLPHEMQHYWLDKIFSVYKRAKAGELKVRDEWMTETKELFGMLGIDENQTQLTEGQQEKFARMSEAYLTGMGVSGDMNATFKEYQHWIPEKYKSMMNLAYKDDDGKIVLPYLDQAAVDFFNKWYANYSLPSLATSPERQEFINPEDENGEVLPVSIKEMNNRDKEFGVDAEEQVKTDQRLYNTLDENMPAEIKIESDGQKVVQESRSNFLKESEKQQRRWFERKSRDTEAQLAQDYIEKNPEHAKEVVYGDPELVPNDTGIDRATLINAYMALNKITPESEDWATLQTNIAINQSLAGTQLALSNNTSYRTYLDALREIENAREMKVATNYAGAKQGAVERFNRDIQRFVDQELPKVLATAPNSQAREIALKSLFEMARTKFSGNTTGGFLNQIDLDFAKAQKGASAAFTRWAINQIKKDAGAKLNNQEQAKLLEISAKAQQAVTDLDDRNIGKAVAGAVAIREWQVEKDKLSGVSPEKFSLFGDWAPRAMLASFNTLVVSNIPSTAMNTLVVRMLESGVFGDNNVSKSLTDSEIKRIKAIYGASAMNLAQMEKPTSPSLLHGEKYSSSGQKWYDPFVILGKEDNWFRVPTFVNTLARIATQDAKATGRDADEVFKEYCRLENQSDEAKLARKQALAVSNMAVFTQDGGLARALNGIRDWINKGSRTLMGLDPKGFGLGNLLTPFLKTGANIAEMGIRGSIAPITTISALAQSWRSGKAIDPMKKLALAMDWSYFALSSLAVALLSALTSDDDEFYTDPYETGKAYDPNKPYDSINIAGVWIDLDFFGVFAIPIRTGCKLVKQWKTDNLSAIYKGYGQGLKYAAMDTPLLQEIFNNQISYASKKTEDWATGLAYNQVNKFVPSQIKPLSRAISRGTGTELDISGAGKIIERKFHRNYGFDGAELTTQDLIDIFTTKITYQE